MSDQYARALLPPRNREQIYGQLNPCNYQLQDNCPSAAHALYQYLNDGQIRPAFCPQPGQGFIVNANFIRPPGRNARDQLDAIIAVVMNGQPGNHVVIHAIRPGVTVQERQNQQDMRAGRTPREVLAPDHYASLVKIGPPYNDVFIADCSRPDALILFPSRGSTPHPEQGNDWTGTIGSFLLYRTNRINGFEYTYGPFQVIPEPIQQGWRSGGFPKQPGKAADPITSYRPTDKERGL
jgi:hypothetical protein